MCLRIRGSSSLASTAAGGCGESIDGFIEDAVGVNTDEGGGGDEVSDVCEEAWSFRWIHRRVDAGECDLFAVYEGFGRYESPLLGSDGRGADAFDCGSDFGFGGEEFYGGVWYDDSCAPLGSVVWAVV